MCAGDSLFSRLSSVLRRCHSWGIKTEGIEGTIKVARDGSKQGIMTNAHRGSTSDSMLGTQERALGFNGSSSVWQ